MPGLNPIELGDSFVPCFVPCSSDRFQPHFERIGGNWLMRCSHCNKTGGVGSTPRDAVALWDAENRPMSIKE